MVAINSFSHVELKLRTCVGFLLWGISGILSVHLFLSFSDRSLAMNLILGATAIAMEASKILTWRAGKWYRIFSVALICLSGIASFGASLEVVESAKGSALFIQKSLATNPEYIAQQSELISLDTEINSLISRMTALPPDYTTAAKNLSETIQNRRESKRQVVQNISVLEKQDVPAGPANMFVLIGRTIHSPTERVMLFLLLMIAAVLEVGGIILTSLPFENEKKAIDATTGTESRVSTRMATVAESNVSYNRPTASASAQPNHIRPEEFLEAAKQGAIAPYLRGRDATAKSVGVSYGEAKRLVASLISSGQIKVKGKRLVLNEQKAS